jgi:hypothetical protein
MVTLIEVDVEKGKIFIRTIEADAASGNVLPGKAGSYTYREIWDWCNDNLTAPYDGEGNYSGFSITNLD